ncbi:MAG: DNA recombination protein RmuC [Candidatus Falkowbacteria bacterium]|nr:DNA recombination protein RmuC [Candidatus Falkowbacteria bacterium]
MENLFIIILVIAALLVGALLIIIITLLKKSGQSTESGALMERLANLSEQSKEMKQVLDNKLSETHTVTRQQFSESSQLIKEVTEKLTKLDETNRQVINFSSQLQSLQDILKNPKQRGVLGEYYLETLLKNVMPPGSYQMQYAFKNKTIVDAVVFVKDKIIPIDSKFSLENYNRIIEAVDQTERERYEKIFLNDLKNRIVETSKYIQPEQGTMEFAFMFIPHEAIYYDLLINKIGAINEETENLIQRAASKYKVIIVSPTSFLAYLQTVLQGLRAMQIEESAKSIIVSVGKLSQHLGTYETYLTKLGSSLGTTVNHFNTAHKEFVKIDKDVTKISGQAASVEPITLNRPTLDEGE